MHEIYKPIRDPQHRNYLSRENYPLDILPPFALGNFYILSGDLWGFIGKNAASLRPTGTLEDVSIAVYMAALQVINSVYSIYSVYGIYSAYGVCSLI